MIFEYGTINFFYSQFKKLSATQREAIKRALNEDANKLMAEYRAEGSHEPALAQLQSEMRECNRILNQFAAQIASGTSVLPLSSD